MERDSLVRGRVLEKDSRKKEKDRWWYSKIYSIHIERDKHRKNKRGDREKVREWDRVRDREREKTEIGREIERQGQIDVHRGRASVIRTYRYKNK